MAGKNGSVGRLFVSVDANTTPAINALKRVSAQAYRTTQALNKINSGGSNTGMEKMAAGMDKTKKSTKGLGDEIDKTSKKFKGMGDQTKAVGKPMANLQAATYRLSQSFVNLRYGNPLGVFSGLTSAATSTGRAISGVGGKSKLAGGLVLLLLVVAVAAVGVGIARSWSETC